jgi:hypothetical protein
MRVDESFSATARWKSIAQKSDVLEALTMTSSIQVFGGTGCIQCGIIRGLHVLKGARVGARPPARFRVTCTWVAWNRTWLLGSSKLGTLLETSKPRLIILSEEFEPLLRGRCSECEDVTFSVSKNTNSPFALMHAMFVEHSRTVHGE